MPDTYLLNSSLFEGKPKLSLGNYVSDKEIPVPRRYFSLDQALDSGKPFIIRSEHIDEYNGPSGLLHSLRVTEMDKHYAAQFQTERALNPANTHIADLGELNQTQIRDAIILQLGHASQAHIEQQLIHADTNTMHVQAYCRYTGINIDNFQKDISYSYWELLDGLNRSIVADSAIKGRYHLFSHEQLTTGKQFNNYTIFDNGDITLNTPDPLSAEQQRDIPRIINFYEKIRQLPRFDSNHCPIVEFQTVNNIHYFLQYHRTRDFSPATFRLTREPERGEAVANLVRGTTPANGIVVHTIIMYNQQHLLNHKLQHEEAAYDLHNMSIFKELISRKRQVNFFNDNERGVAYKAADDHLDKTQLFKSELSIVLPIGKIAVDENDLNQAFELAKSRSTIQIPLRVISDGRTCYVKRLDMDEDTLIARRRDSSMHY
jgi:hypothetical protein